MGKLTDFFGKWGRVASLGAIGIMLLFALGCCIYTSITNPFVGITGIIGVVLALGGVVLRVYLDIAANDYDTTN